MSEDAQPLLYPAWRQLERDLLDAGLPDGATIPMDRLRSGLGVRDPATLNGADVMREQLQFNSAMGSLMASLLENHRIKLRLVEGVGYMVVPPEDQTRLAIKERGAEVQNVIEKAFRDVTYVRTEALTDEQRRENADAVAKFASLGLMTKERLKLASTD